MVPPSPVPMPSGLSGFGVSTCSIWQAGTSEAAGRTVRDPVAQRLCSIVVVHALEQGVANAVRDAALHLAIDDQRD